MARYPTFEEYQKRGNYADGLKKCTDLLQKNPNDVQLLTVQIRLLAALKRDITPILDRLVALTPPIQDTQILLTIEEAVVDSQHDVYPRPRSVGLGMNTLHANALKSLRTVDQKLELQSLRFTTAIYDDRLEDAQQSLIQMKALQPRNRVLYMAHAAITQLLSVSPQDLQARLAGSLARKAIKENFDEDSALDCRVPGQILALQGAMEEVKELRPRFAESKQVFDAQSRQNGVAGEATNERQPLLDDDDDDEVEGKAKDRSKITAAAEFTGKVDRLKRGFAGLIQNSAEGTSVVSFAVDAIETFHSASQALGSGKGARLTVDACFLAMSALVRIFEQSANVAHLLQAAFLAEYLLKHDPHIHEARLISVYLYMRLGLGSKAADCFDSLKTKEIQYDTVGHTLFTELSYTHPHGVAISRRETFEPSKRATQALATYTRCEDKLAETEAAVLNHGQSGMIFDLHELRTKLHSSLARRMTLLEQRRLVRLTQGKPGEDMTKLGPRLLPTWLEFCDNRDFNATFSFEYNVEKALYNVHGASVGKEWLLYSLMVDAAWCLARGLTAPIIDPRALVNEYSETMPTVAMDNLQIDPPSQAPPRLDNFYRLCADLACQVLKLLLQVDPARESTIAPDETLAAVSQALDKLNLKTLVTKPDPLTDSLKSFYATIDILNVTARACQAAEPQLKTHAAALQEIRKSAKSGVSALQTEARTRAKRARKSIASDVRRRMEAENSIWTALEGFGKERIGDFCDAVAESAREGWEGVGVLTLE